MKSVILRVLLVMSCSGCWIAASAQISSFQHVVIVFQENRTPDNLFQGLCSSPYGGASSCSTNPSNSQYNIQTSNWLDNAVPGGVIQPLTVALNARYDLAHRHSAFVQQCDLNADGQCAMDGAAAVSCNGSCPTQPQFRYVDNSAGYLNPYLTLATQYGWGNHMFQTNQGPSFPAHQFIFGGTSAPSAADDAAGTYASENDSLTHSGCLGKAHATVQLMTVDHGEGKRYRVFPCFEHATIPDVLPANLSWRYYTPGAGSIWTAPDAIEHICQPDQPYSGQCVGASWLANVDLVPHDVLKDIKACNLRNLTWAIPGGANSDHAGKTTVHGPSWVASIVNAIGESTCTNPDGSSYWNTTAIVITWDDWGGWYDHEAPPSLPLPFGDYQYGFRVPLIVVSAYTPVAYISNKQYDFGSVLRFIEQNFGLTEGVLNFADARAANDLTDFFNLNLAPRVFVPISTTKSVDDFLKDNSPVSDPDDD